MREFIAPGVLFLYYPDHMRISDFHPLPLYTFVIDLTDLTDEKDHKFN